MKTDTIRAQHNREKILRAALKLFQSRGIRKVSMHDIATGAGLTPATLYNHFGTKETLVHRTLAYYLETTIGQFKEIIDSDLSFIEKFERMLAIKMDAFTNDQTELIQLLASGGDEINRIVNEIYAGGSQQWARDFYEEGKQQGIVNPDLPTETIIMYSEILREGVSALARRSDDPDFIRRMIEALTPIYLYGIMGRPEPAPNEPLKP